jgi:hypothetical protein
VTDRLRRRAFPLLAAVVLVVIGMLSTTWWGPAILGRTQWSLPDDLWATLHDARRVAHLDLAGLYATGTGLISFPGTAAILVPVVAVTDALGISLATPGAANPHPTAWLVAGSYMIAISAIALFAADALAERMGVDMPKRLVLAASEGAALWGVSAQWGHPEDAVAVGLFLYAVLALADGRRSRAAWLTGAAVAVQPLALMALPMLLMVIEPRRLAGFLTRAAAPAAALLGAAAASNWNATFHAVTTQPNWPTVDKPTPWLEVPLLVRNLGDGSVSSGPARLLAIAVACGCALVAGRRWRAGWPGSLPDLLWWVAVAFALRTAFEPVMVAYYFWPVLAVALVTAAGAWPRLLAATVTSAVLTFGSQVSWRGYWSWWAPVVALLAVTLFLAHPGSRWPWSVQPEDPGSVIPQETVADLSGQV